MLLGWALRTFGPGMRYQDADGSVQRADFLMAKISWRRFAAGLGAVIATAGAALILITFILILINPGDSTGSLVAWICFGLILLAVAVWAWFYVGRYGIHGVLPDRQEASHIFRSKQEPARPLTPAAAQEEVAVDDYASEDEALYDEPVDEDAYDEFGVYVDDDYADEMESRYAKYQMHHPDGTDAVDADREEEPYEEPLGEPQADEVGESEVIHLVASAQVAEVPGEEPEGDREELLGPGEPDAIRSTGAVAGDIPVQADHIPETGQPQGEPGLAPVLPAADDEDIAGDVAASDRGETGSAHTTDFPEDDEVKPSNDAPLEDTEEGRAEALRRLLEWHPEKSSDKES